MLKARAVLTSASIQKPKTFPRLCLSCTIAVVTLLIWRWEDKLSRTRLRRMTAPNSQAFFSDQRGEFHWDSNNALQRRASWAGRIARVHVAVWKRSTSGAATPFRSRQCLFRAAFSSGPPNHFSVHVTAREKGKVNVRKVLWGKLRRQRHEEECATMTPPLFHHRINTHVRPPFWLSSRVGPPYATGSTFQNWFASSWFWCTSE